SGLKVSNRQPQEKPPEPDLSCEYLICKHYAERSYALNKKYTVKKSAEYSVGDWKVLVEKANDCFCPLYTGLGPVERDIVYARQWAAEFRSFYEYHSHVYVALADAPSAEQMNCFIFQCWKRDRVQADCVGAEYRCYNRPIFIHYREKPFLIYERLKVVHPRYFAGPEAKSIYDKHRDDLSRVDALRP